MERRLSGARVRRGAMSAAAVSQRTDARVKPFVAVLVKERAGLVDEGSAAGAGRSSVAPIMTVASDW
jgi:hypothetical protein